MPLITNGVEKNGQGMHALCVSRRLERQETESDRRVKSELSFFEGERCVCVCVGGGGRAGDNGLTTLNRVQWSSVSFTERSREVYGELSVAVDRLRFIR